MSNNAFIELIAKLNETQSTNFITRQLDKISREMKENGYAFRINCKIDENSKKELEKQLSAMASSLNINFNNDKSTKTPKSTTQSKDTTTTTVKIDKMSVESQIDELNKLLQSKLQGEANAVMKELVSSLRNSLGETTEIWTTWEKTADGALTDFSVSAKKATGDLEKFNFVVNETGKVNLLGSSGSDKGILQKQKETLKFIDEYTAKINSLRSPSTQNFTALYGKETVTFESLNKDLENLRKGEGSIEEVRGKFVALQGAISSVRDIIKESQGKSLDPFTNAKIAAKEFSNTLKSINVDLNNLKGFNYTGKAKDMPQVSKLTNDYKELKKTITTLNAVEESQRGNQWYKDFADASEKVRQLQSDIKLLNKLKREDTSSSTKKQYEELSKIINAYREMQKLEKRRYADKTGENEINKINSLEGGYRRIINTTQERLKNTGLLTSEIKKLIDAEEKAFNKSVNYAKAQQQDRQARIKAATDEKQANDNRSRYMSEITNAYSRMNAEYSKLYNPKLSQDERNLAQQRIDWNDKIIKHNRELLDTENLLTQKNKDKLNQLKEINQQKEKEAQAGANRVTQSQAETERLKQEKKEAKDLATTVTQIVNGYEKLATLYSGKTAPTNGTAKSDINKAESARQHSELQAQLSELTEIANANDKITKQQQEQIANAKIQYEQSVERTNQYNQQIINEQNQIQADRESIELAKQQQKVRQDILGDIKLAYDQMNKLNGIISNSRTGEKERQDAERQYAIAKQTAVSKEEELRLYALSCEYSSQLTQEEEKKLQKYKELNQNQESLNEKHRADIQQSQLDNAKYEEKKRLIKEITDLYSKSMIKTNRTLFNSSPDSENYQNAQALLSVQEAQLKTKTKLLNMNHELTGDEESQIIAAREKYQWELKGMTAKANDTKAAEQQAEQIRKEKAEYDKLLATIKEYQRILSGFNNANVVKQNKGNSIVAQQTSDNTSLLSQLETLEKNLGSKDSITTDKLNQVRTAIEGLTDDLNKAKDSSTQLKNSLADERTNQATIRQFNNLKNNMETFANVSQRAVNSTLKMIGSNNTVTTFKAEWNDLMNRMQDPKILGNKNAITKLQDDFRNFQGQARSTGLVTNKFFTDMGSQLKMVLNRYISLYAIIGYIRKMVDNVKQLDEAMINLRRVTDETENGYTEFLEKANKQAQELRITTSELVEQTYQWSKLGYDLEDALNLSKASTIFSKVADTTQEQAMKNLITILKAYGIEAKNVMDIVDKMDNLNNRYAVSAEGLGEGLEKSASALAMTGNSLEQSLAMLTGASEITQNAENTGQAIKILSLRLQGMKGKLEELEEPVDDLMEVSKVQTQILNLTHNQVDIFDSKTGAFKSTYKILEDISAIWDSLNSQSRSSLTEIMFGKNRANVGLALIQSFQSGQTQKALKDALNSTGVATKEYEKMIDGITSHSNALKGALQELSTTITNSDTINSVIDKGKTIVTWLTKIIDLTGSLGVVLAPILAMWSFKTGANIISILKSIAISFGLIKGEALNAQKAITAFKTIGKAALSAFSGLVISLVITALSSLVDKLITTNSEMNDMVKEATDAMVDLKHNADELESSMEKIDSIAASYSKAAVTISDVTERKIALTEVQNELNNSYGEEAKGIDLINGKYSEQIKKLDELKQKEKADFEIKNAAELANAKRYSKLYVDDIYKAASSPYKNGYDQYERSDAKKGDRSLYSIADLDERVARIASEVDGAYASLRGSLDLKGIYLSGSIEDARNQLKIIIEEYGKLSNVEDKSMDALTARYTQLNAILESIATNQEYIDSGFDKWKTAPEVMTEAVNNAVGAVKDAEFNNKLDETYEKLQKLANPENLSYAEYSNLLLDVQILEDELYKMAGTSVESKDKVKNLFDAFKIGTSENGDKLDEFTKKFEDTLENSFKTTGETITTVQEAISKLGEGKGLSHTDAWKLLKEDTEGYLKTIKLVNGEYVFSEEELIAYKDAVIQKAQEEIRASNASAMAEYNATMLVIETQKKHLKQLEDELAYQAKLHGINSQADADMYGAKEIAKTKIKIEESEEELKKFANLIDRNNLLVEELNQNLGRTRTISVGIETELNNNVSNLEAQVKAIDNSVDELNARKKTLESEKKVMQEQLDVLKEQEETLKEQMDNFKKAVNNYLKRYEDSLKTQLDHIKDQKEEVKDEYDKRIKALKDENEERDLAYKKEKAILDLSKAKEQQVRTYSSARGWEYGASKEKVVEAQKNLQDVLTDEQINALEKERDTKVEALEEQEKAYDKHIKAFQEYAKKYEDITEEIEGSEGELLAEQILGSEWRVEIERQDEELLKNYTTQYKSFNTQLTNLVNNEIKQLEASIDMKDKEINKIDEEITAYNELKNAVQSDLNEAKNALENYKSTVETVATDVSKALETMEGNAWDRSWKVKQYNDEMAKSAESASNRMCAAYGAVSGALGALALGTLHDTDVGVGMAGAAGILMGLVGSHAEGGVNSETGLAMLHGTKQKSETIFNAEDSKKLYDYVHKTPDITASMIEEATKISGFKFGSAVNNNSTANTVSLNIGQVVANSPQEFTKNLDTHIDAYFRRKLTQGYVQ